MLVKGEERSLNYIKTVSLFMSYLIISLTFLSAFATAEIYSAQATGNDGANGYIKPTDTIKVSSQSLLPTSVDFFNDGNFTLMSCNDGVPITCTYSKPITNRTGSLIVVVRESGSLQKRTMSVYVDDVAPKIDQVTFSGIGYGVKADYRLSDKSSVGGKCSGIKKVELQLNGKVAVTKSHNVSDCAPQGSIEGTIPNMEGAVNASLVIYDYVGLKTFDLAKTSFNIESKPPKISSKIDVFLSGTQEKLTTVPPNTTIHADIMVSVSDESMGQDVFANFSEVTGNGEFFRASCDTDGKNATCTFSGVPLKMGKSGLKAIIFAKDNPGNLVNLTASLPVTVSVPRVMFKFTATRTGDGARNVTRIPGPNSTKSLMIDLTAIVTSSSPVAIDHIEGDFSDFTNSAAAPIGGNATNSTGNTTAGNTTAPVVANSIPSDKCEPAEEQNNTYVCKFRSIPIKAKKTDAKINMTVVDVGGGVYSQSTVLPFLVVQSAGTLSSLMPPPERCLGGVCYLGKGTTNITAVISTQSTFEDSNIKINGVAAKCNATSGWTCIAIVPGASSLTLSGEDDLGNPITGKSSAKIVHDTIAPERVTEFNSTPDCATSSDTLIISANFTDSGGSPTLAIKSDTAQISTNNLSTAQCAGNPTTKQFSCALSVNSIKEEPINTELEVIVEDLAGNQVKTPVPTSICIMSDEIPDFVASIDAVGALPRIDRKVASRVPLKVPLPLEIALADGETYLLERSDVDCSETPGAKEAYLSNELSMSPLMMVSLSYTDAWDNETATDNLTISCKQEFKIRHQNTIYTQPETEEITAALVLFNQPLGTLNETYTRKVNEIKGNLRDLDKKIEKWQKVHDTLGKVCGFAETLGRVNGVLSTLKTAMYFLLVGPAHIPLIGQVIDGLWNAIKTPMESIQSQIEKYVWPSGYLPNGFNTMGLVIKYTCSVYHCKFYDFNTFASIGMSIVGDRMVTNAQRERANWEVENVRTQGERWYTEDGVQIVINPENPDDVWVVNPDGSITQLPPDAARAVLTDGRQLSSANPLAQAEQAGITQIERQVSQEMAVIAAKVNAGTATNEELAQLQRYSEANPEDPVFETFRDDSGRIEIIPVIGTTELKTTDIDVSELSTEVADTESADGTETPPPPVKAAATETSPDIRRPSDFANAQEQIPGTTGTNAAILSDGVVWVRRTSEPGGLGEVYYTRATAEESFAFGQYTAGVNAANQRMIQQDAKDQQWNAYVNSATETAWGVFTAASTGITLLSMGAATPLLELNLLARGAQTARVVKVAYNTAETTQKVAGSVKVLQAARASGPTVQGGQRLVNGLWVPHAIFEPGRIIDDNEKEIISSADLITAQASLNIPSAEMSPAARQRAQGQMQLQQAVDSFMGDEGTWIYNPYKSKHYDKLCIPAILFNSKKEKQLQCRRLACIEDAAKTGGPLEACEFEYEYTYCLYVDGARYKLQGGVENIFSSVFRAMMNSITGLAVTITTQFIYPKCVLYGLPSPIPETTTLCSLLVPLGQPNTPSCTQSVMCGALKAAQTFQEFSAIASGQYNPLANTQVPTELPGEDFCAGVDYAQT